VVIERRGEIFTFYRWRNTAAEAPASPEDFVNLVNGQIIKVSDSVCHGLPPWRLAARHKHPNLLWHMPIAPSVIHPV
jgi:hypothetical protein